MSKAKKSAFTNSTNPSIETSDIVDILDKINSFVSVSEMADEVDGPVTLTDYSDTKALEAAGFGEAQIIEIQRGQEQGVDVRRYANVEYNWMQMREIRFGLAQGVDVSYFENPLYSASQMREIRFGLVTFLDVDSYAKLYLSTTDMNKKRKELFTKSYNLNPNQYGRTVYDDTTGILVRFQDDVMKAYFTVPSKPLSELTQEKITNLLEERNIHYGVKWDILNAIIDGKIKDMEVCIAEGKPSRHGKDGWYELHFDNGTDKQTIIAPDDVVDYTAVSTIEVVMPGQLLAEYHPAEKDVAGITVNGIVVDGVPGADLPELHGVGFTFNPEKFTYSATRKGCPSYNVLTNTLNVWDVYHIQGDVTVYQSVEYNGTIHVHGSVGSMATIRAKGDIIIDGFVEGANIYSDHDVVLKRGVNGGDAGIISAGGSVKGRFFENARVRAKGSVEGNYFLNCNIMTDERVKAYGRKARIMGGRITAAISVEAVTIGNYLGIKTTFTVGDIADLEYRLLELNKNINTLSEQLAQLTAGKEQLEQLFGLSGVRSNALYEKTTAAIKTLEAQTEEQNREINRLSSICSRAEKAFVKVHGELQEGVVFFINGNRTLIEKTINHGIVLTKENKKGRKH